MILTAKDISDFSRIISLYIDDFDSDEKNNFDEEHFFRWISNNPQVIMASGYQEFVACTSSSLYQKLVTSGELDPIHRPLFRTYEGSWIVPSHLPYSDIEELDAFRLEGLIKIQEMQKELDLMRKNDEGITNQQYWHELQSNLDTQSLQSIVSMPSFEVMIERANRYVDNPLLDNIAWISPKLWTPLAQTAEKESLRLSSLAIIKELQENKLQLSDIHWRDFENIIAEVLQSKGMEIHVVRESPQGGRDIIARAELIPGSEILTIAIEVKHRKVVDRPMLEKAIHQNRQFPALMLVTSGSFTAGVLKEVSSPYNRLRIILKDGIAIRDMIRLYRL